MLTSAQIKADQAYWDDFYRRRPYHEPIVKAKPEAVIQPVLELKKDNFEWLGKFLVIMKEDVLPAIGYSLMLCGWAIFVVLAVTFLIFCGPILLFAGAAGAMTPTK